MITHVPLWKQKQNGPRIIFKFNYHWEIATTTGISLKLCYMHQNIQTDDLLLYIFAVRKKLGQMNMTLL